MYGRGSAGGLGTAGGDMPMDGSAGMMPSDNPDPQAAVYELTKYLDPRIKPVSYMYSAPIGAQSSTSVNVQLTQVNDTAHTFPITPPSPGVVIQGNPMYDLTCQVEFTAQRSNSVPAGAMFPRYGVDFAIASPSPLNNMVNNWQVTFNNTTVNSQNIGQPDIVYLTENPTTRAARGCTYKTPVLLSWDDAYGTTSSIGDISGLQGKGDVQPGTYYVEYCIPAGANIYYSTQPLNAANYAWQGPLAPPAGATPNARATLSACAALVITTAPGAVRACYSTAVPNNVPFSAATATDGIAVGFTLGTAASYPFFDGQPFLFPSIGTSSQGCAANTAKIPAGIPYVLQPGGTAVAPTPAGSQLSTYRIQTRIIDPIQCPPLYYATEHGMASQGFWGINNMLVIANLATPGTARWLQFTTKGGMQTCKYTGWTTVNGQIWLQYYTPPQTPQTLLPAKCVLPMLYKQYNIYPTPEAIAAYSAKNVAVPSYVFSTVSDFLSFSGRPQVGSDAWNAGNLADFLLMWGDQPFNQFQYANMSGVLSNMSKQQLVAICRQNGVQASVEQFGGLDGAGSTAATGVNTGYAMKSGMRVATAGAPLVLRPGKDFPLPLGVSAGTTGNVQLQYNITLYNNSPVASKFDILTMALSTSYLIIVNGACKTMLVGLDEETLLKAAYSDGDTFSMPALVGGGAWDWMKKIGRAAWDNRNTIYKAVRGVSGLAGIPLPNIDLGGNGFSGGAGAGSDPRKRTRESGGGQGRNTGSLLASLATM